MRNIKKETEWSKQRYKQLTYRCPKDTAAQLDEKLKAEKLTWSKWVKERIETYLKGR